MEKTEIILQANGTFTERVIKERDLDVESAVLEALTEGVTCKRQSGRQCQSQ